MVIVHGNGIGILAIADNIIWFGGLSYIPQFFLWVLVQDETCFFFRKFMIDVISVVGLVFKPTYYRGCFFGKFSTLNSKVFGVKHRIKTWYQQKWVNLWWLGGNRLFVLIPYRILMDFLFECLEDRISVDPVLRIYQYELFLGRFDQQAVAVALTPLTPWKWRYSRAMSPLPLPTACSTKSAVS